MLNTNLLPNLTPPHQPYHQVSPSTVTQSPNSPLTDESRIQTPSPQSSVISSTSTEHEHSHSGRITPEFPKYTKNKRTAHSPDSPKKSTSSFDPSFSLPVTKRDRSKARPLLKKMPYTKRQKLEERFWTKPDNTVIGNGATAAVTSSTFSKVVIRKPQSNIPLDTLPKVTAKKLKEIPGVITPFDALVTDPSKLQVYPLITYKDKPTDLKSWLASLIDKYRHNQAGACDQQCIDQKPEFTMLIKVASELIHTVTQMHSKKIYHMDLKPENIMLSDDTNRPTITIIDVCSVIDRNDDDPDDGPLYGYSHLSHPHILTNAQRCSGDFDPDLLPTYVTYSTALCILYACATTALVFSTNIGDQRLRQQSIACIDAIEPNLDIEADFDEFMTTRGSDEHGIFSQFNTLTTLLNKCYKTSIEQHTNQPHDQLKKLCLIIHSLNQLPIKQSLLPKNKQTPFPIEKLNTLIQKLV